MTDDIYRTQVRFPSVLAEKLKQLAKDSDESFNSEVVARLEQSVTESERETATILTAEQARKLAESGLAELRDDLMADCMTAIRNSVKSGTLEAEVYSEEGYQGWSADYCKNIVAVVSEKLFKIGYGIEWSKQGVKIDISPREPYLIDADNDFPPL